MSHALAGAASIAIDAVPARPVPAVPRLRVLLVCDSLSIGGAERHVIGLAAALERRGHDVTITSSTYGELDREALDAGIALRPIARGLVKRRVSVDYSRQLTRVVSRGHFDVVHAHMHASAAAAAIACARTGVPLVITEHSEATWRDVRAWRTSHSAYRRAAFVIAVSDGIARRLIEVDRVIRVNAIHNAIAALGRGPALLRGAVSGAPIIGVVARLVPEKGIACFLHAAEDVQRTLAHASFVVIGDGPLRAELVALSERLGIASRVHFLGARTDGPQLVAELDVLAVPSLSEGTPLVTLEALSAGVPIVASRVGGIPDQVRGFGRVALVPPDDSAALARAIVEMARAIDPTPLLSRFARIALLPTHEAMVRRTETVYAMVVAEARRRAESTHDLPRRLWLAR